MTKHPIQQIFLSVTNEPEDQYSTCWIHRERYGDPKDLQYVRYYCGISAASFERVVRMVRVLFAKDGSK